MAHRHCVGRIRRVAETAPHLSLCGGARGSAATTEPGDETSAPQSLDVVNGSRLRPNTLRPWGRPSLSNFAQMP
jgi:hypothetical protein